MCLVDYHVSSKGLGKATDSINYKNMQIRGILFLTMCLLIGGGLLLDMAKEKRRGVQLVRQGGYVMVLCVYLVHGPVYMVSCT